MPENAKRRDAGKKREFKPKEEFPITNAVLSAMLFALVPWVFISVTITSYQVKLLIGFLVGSAVAILACEWVGERDGIWLSGTVLAREPFNDPLQVIGMKTRTKHLVKFKSQTWQLVIHSAMVIVELNVINSMLGEQSGADLFAEPWRMAYMSDPIPPLLEMLYIFQMAVWIITGFFHVFVFEQQSDYLVMLGHHVATIGLLGISWQHGYARYGLLVLYVHDISDIVIDLLKMTNYLKLEDMSGMFLTEICFVTNLFTWAYYRLYILPVFIVYNGCWKSMACASGFIYQAGGDVAKFVAIFQADKGLCYAEQDIKVLENLAIHGKNFAESVGDVAPYYSIYYSASVAVALLCVLLVMHMYWYALFYRILHGLLTGKTASDVGADQYEGDDGVAEVEKKSK